MIVKKEETKPNSSRRKKTKIKVEINKVEAKSTTEKMNKTKFLF